MNLSMGLGDLFDDMDEWYYSQNFPLEIWIDSIALPFREWLTYLKEDAHWNHYLVDAIMWAVVLAVAIIGTAIFMTLLLGFIKLVKLIREGYFERKYRRPVETRMAHSRTGTARLKPVVERIAEKQDDTALPADDVADPLEDTLDEEIITEVIVDGERLTKSDLHQYLKELVLNDASNPGSSIEKFSAVLSPESKYYRLLDDTLKADIEAIVNPSDRQVTDKDTLVAEHS